MYLVIAEKPTLSINYLLSVHCFYLTSKKINNQWVVNGINYVLFNWYWNTISLAFCCILKSMRCWCVLLNMVVHARKIISHLVNSVCLLESCGIIMLSSEYNFIIIHLGLTKNNLFPLPDRPYVFRPTLWFIQVKL